MPEYQHPGVYIEEAAGPPPPIAPAPTSLTAFLGVTETGPTTPTWVDSPADYTARFGAGDGLMPHVVSGFFANGGSRLLVARIVPAKSQPVTCADFEGGGEGETATGLAALEQLAFAEVSLVYAPDAQATPGLVQALVAHCEKVGHRLAVLDAPAGTTSPAPPMRSDRAALYHPWLEVAVPAPAIARKPTSLRVPQPLRPQTRLVPPGGHVLGVYARVDAERAVWKAPANEELRGIVGLAATINDLQQEVMNPVGINAIREFPGRGRRVWGARTLSDDPEWKYVSVRRYFDFLERSLGQGLQWAVFELNAPPLWARVAASARLFLLDQWRAGALQGIKEEQAFFVRCGRNLTMTQADIDAGRLVCEIGVAPVRPAEFVIFRVALTTAPASA